MRLMDQLSSLQQEKPKLERLPSIKRPLIAKPTQTRASAIEVLEASRQKQEAKKKKRKLF